MKVLWFEVTIPGRYYDENRVVSGWQDSLENVVRNYKEIELVISFVGRVGMTTRTIDGVKYIPIIIEYKRSERKRAKEDYHSYTEKLLPLMKGVVEDEQPDLIHVFGTEYAFGLIARYTAIPVVIHIQGSYIPYNNATYPPNYSITDKFRQVGWAHPRRIHNAISYQKLLSSIEEVERETWNVVFYYMGRTEWDKALSDVLHPGRKYFHVEEALRPQFINGNLKWSPIRDGKLRLISTGCGTFWKGPDMILKTARILTELGINFEWNIVGKMYDDIKQMVENKEKGRFENYHVKLIGRLNPDELSRKLCESTIYVHTAYIENSPNSICEAQCLGVPIVSTNVGGISSLVRDGKDGILVAANDPWQMAYAIKELAKDGERQLQYSNSSRDFALQRHNPQHILDELLSCYREILKSK